MAVLQDSPLRASQLRALERRQESSLSFAVDRLRLSEDTHERNLEPLQSQADSLRRLLEVTAQTHSRDLMQLREQMQARLETESRVQESTVRAGQARLAEVQRQWAAERDRVAQMRQELLELRLRNGSDIGRRQEEDRTLRTQLERLKLNVMGALHSEISAAQDGLVRTREEHTRRLALLQAAQQREINSVQDRAAVADAQMNRSELEGIALRQDLQRETESGERELVTLQGSLRTLRSEAKSQAEELDRLSRARDSALGRARDLSVEASRLKRQRRHFKASSQQLRSSSVKLERLVYGRRPS